MLGETVNLFLGEDDFIVDGHVEHPALPLDQLGLYAEFF